MKIKIHSVKLIRQTEQNQINCTLKISLEELDVIKRLNGEEYYKALGKYFHETLSEELIKFKNASVAQSGQSGGL